MGHMEAAAAEAIGLLAAGQKEAAAAAAATAAWLKSAA